MKKPVIVIVALALVATGVVAWLLTRPPKHGGELVVSGNIEVDDVALSFRIPGWVTSRPVDEGQTVRKGQLIAALDTRDLEADLAGRKAEQAAAAAALAAFEAGTRKEDIEAARAAAARAQGVLDELKAGSRPQEIAAAKSAADAAEAELKRRQTVFDRVQKLYQAGSSSIDEFDEARYALDAARSRLEEARQRATLVELGPRKEQIEQAAAAAQGAQAAYELAKNGPRKEDIDAARARLAQAEAAVMFASTRLGYGTLYSPLDGIVLSKNIEPGEYAAPGTPVVTVADLHNVYMRAYVPETDLGRVKQGQAASIVTDTYPGRKYEGRITFISQEAEFTPKNVQTPQERVKLVYRIRIDVQNPALELKPGMPADATIATQ